MSSWEECSEQPSSTAACKRQSELLFWIVDSHQTFCHCQSIESFRPAQGNFPCRLIFVLQGPHRNPSSEFSQSLRAFVSGIVVFVRGSLKFVRGEIHHVQIVLPGVT